MVSQTVEASAQVSKKTIEEIKEEARRLAFPESENLGTATAEGNKTPEGQISQGYSQTGEFIASPPAQVTPDSSNPALPPKEVAKTIPCRFYPACKYGDQCAFSHAGPTSNNAQNGTSPPYMSPTSPSQMGGFYYPNPNGNSNGNAPSFAQPPPHFPVNGYSADPHAAQGGMSVPVEYSNYINMSGYNANIPRGPMSHYPTYPGYGSYMMPPPPSFDNNSSTGGARFSADYPYQNQNGSSTGRSYNSPRTNGNSPTPPTSISSPDSQHQQNVYSHHQQHQFSANGHTHQVNGNGIPNNHINTQYQSQAYPMSANGRSHPSSASHNSTSPTAANPNQIEAVMAASGLSRSSAVHTTATSRPPVHLHKRNSLSLGSNINRRPGSFPPSGPIANGSMRVGRPTDSDRFPYKKRADIDCAYFMNNNCRNGDTCEFAHYFADGSNAKDLGQNVIGIDGKTGDLAVLEDFRAHRAAIKKDRKARESFGAQSDVRGRERFLQSQSNGHFNSQGYKNVRHYSANGHLPSQRIPNGNDFPALPAQISGGSDVNGDLNRSSSRDESIPDDSSAHGEKLSASVTSDGFLATKSVSSFASAAARGAQAPQPSNNSHTRSSTAKSEQSAFPIPHSSPDLSSASPILSSEPVLAA